MICICFSSAFVQDHVDDVTFNAPFYLRNASVNDVSCIVCLEKWKKNTMPALSNPFCDIERGTR